MVVSLVFQFVILLTALFTTSLTVTVLFPFLPHMVQDFDPELPETDVGYRVGLIGSAFMVGRAIMSVPWGMFSDRFGRKPAMVMSLVSSIVCSIALGTSTSLWGAITVRFLAGLLNPAAGMAKAYVAELAGPSHAARGMSVVGLAWGSGIIVGSSMGGVLSEPGRKYPNAFPKESIFSVYPYLLPNLVVAILNVLIVPFFLVLLPETVPWKGWPPALRNLKYRILRLFGVKSGGVMGGLEMRDMVAATTASISGTTASSAHDNGDDSKSLMSEASLQHNHAESDGEEDDLEGGKHSSESEGKLTKGEGDGVAMNGAGVLHEVDELDTAKMTKRSKKGETEAETNKPKKEKRILLQKTVMATIAVYGLHSCADLMYFESVPVLLQTSTQYGGFFLDSTDVGILLMVAGAGSMVCQVAVFPPVAKRFGSVACFRWCCALTAVLIAFTPIVQKFNLAYIPVMAVLGVVMTLRQCTTLVAFTANFLIINNSVSVAHRGSVNGIAMMLGSFFKAIGPVTGTSLFAWSLSSDLPGVNAFFAFLVMAAGDLFASGVSFALPQSLNAPKAA